MNKDVLHIGICILLFVFLRYLFSVVSVEIILFLLWPVQTVVGLFFNTSGSFTTGEGYYFPALHIIIGKSCAGFNFMLTCFLLTSFVFIRKNIKPFWLIIPLSLLISYLLTLFANISRIISYLFLKETGLFPAGSPHEAMYHTMTGIVVYLFILVLFYFILQKHVLNIKNKAHEKVA